MIRTRTTLLVILLASSSGLIGCAEDSKSVVRPSAPQCTATCGVGQCIPAQGFPEVGAGFFGE